MTARWPIVPLGAVLTSRVEPFRVEPERAYPIAGVFGYGRGVICRPPVSGAEIAADRIYRIHSRQVLYSRLKSFEGAFAIVPAEADGFFVSNEFPSFDVDETRADYRYIGWYLRRPATWLALSGEGRGIGARRERLHPSKFLAHPLPLPPLDEQRRIVARLDSAEAHLGAIKALRSERDSECEQLLRALTSFGSDTALVPMSTLVRLREPDVTVNRHASYDFAGVYSFGRGVFRAGTKSGTDFAYPRLSTLRAGDFTYPKLMAWEGALGVVPPECHGCVVSPEFPVFEVLQDRVLPEVIDVHFRNPNTWPHLASSSTGTNARRRRLNPSDFLDYPFPLPSRNVQRTIANAYRLSREIRQLNQSIEADTRAILPALLALAFSNP